MSSPPQAAADSRLIRAVGTWALAASIVNVTIGGGIFRLPAGVYAALGQSSPIAYLVCAAVIGLIVVCFAEAGSRVAQTGGLYAYIETAFGPLVGFVAGVLLWAAPVDGAPHDGERADAGGCGLRATSRTEERSCTNRKWTPHDRSS